MSLVRKQVGTLGNRLRKQAVKRTVLVQWAKEMQRVRADRYSVLLQSR